MGVTIKEVAKAAGVSVSTVSKVINGHYSISEKTAVKVRQVMEELNYFPSSSAQSFAKGATRTVAVLTNLGQDVAFQNPHMFEIIAGLEETLQKKGYHLLLKGVDKSSTYEVAKDLISRRTVDGLAIHISVLTHALSGLLTQLQFPHIVLGAPNFQSQVCWIDNNNIYSGAVAGQYLISAGYRRIAFVGGQDYDMGSTARLHGLRQALQDVELELDERYIWQGESTRADGYQMTKKLLTVKPLPDAIVCANNTIAVGCMGALQEAGMRIPEAMGVMAFDDYPFSRITDPQLTVVDINVRRMGMQAAKMLIDIMKHPNTQVQTYITTSNLIKRESTK